MNEIDVAWFAGLFEGEGTFTIVKKSYAERISIHMTDLDILEKVQSLLGGRVFVTYEEKGNWKKCYMWYLMAKDAYPIVKRIYPYLGARRKERADFWLALRDQTNSKKVKGISKKLEIKQALESGMTQREVAEQFNVSQPYVSKVAKL